MAWRLLSLAVYAQQNAFVIACPLLYQALLDKTPVEVPGWSRVETRRHAWSRVDLHFHAFSLHFPRVLDTWREIG
ncbi:hypothetical protein FB451DRAFT_1226364 [Mycena latifolia]|nr:hypothetical protein FB451DRAFT_1226364 [Mycena latifolia]